MIIFTDKTTGEIVGTVDGFGEDVGISFEGDNIERTVIGLGHPLEAEVRKLEDPRDNMNILNTKFDGEKFITEEEVI